MSKTVTLTDQQVDQLGRELDAIKQRVVDDLGATDRDYIYDVVKWQRGFEVAGRASLFLGFLPPFWLGGVAALSLSKILDNMEIGHNVMHGQYDWMRDPAMNSKMFEWDTVCPAEQWKHSHNYMHHTYTNILGKDRDIGYGILRMEEAQKWNPYYLGNPVWAFLLMTLFQWGVMAHDLEIERIVTGEKDIRELKPLVLQQWRKAGRQVLKDYVLFPALSGPLFLPTLAANATANLVRNIWSFSIIFCGHFPTGVATFTEEETANETRGQWYLRQMMGSANITGGPLFHIMSGNLSHQIEHHLFPDIPARRYPQIAPEVQALCEKYGLPYNSGGLTKQLGSVWGKIFRLAVPFGSRGVSAPAAKVAQIKVPVAA
ncbi:fatty acid desaturase family protein [uncultured Jatrophihabitans sp.]|uniref:fatty acid desaturase family protein n=1 Tax=uncultured Jatrophihabitans sp. TaxID=1610747 RepID=UPI0035CC9A34